MLRSVQLPTAPQPGWELENPPDDGETELKSIPESLVVLQSLRQSRNKWISSAFPKFSTKARGSKPADVVPPPHTTKAHGRYDVRIGPHVFSGTALYEVHYLPQAPTMVPAYPQQSHAPTTQTGPYTGQPSSMQQASTTQLAMSALSGQSTGTNAQIAIDSLFGSVTPEMSNQINMASISNPTLKNLLNLVATGQAPSDQLKTLELLIQSMRASQPPEPLTGSSSGVNPSLPPAALPSAVKDFDLIIEFAEKQSDRWIIPRGPVRCERTHTDHKGNKLYIPDALLTMTVPVSQHIMTSTEPTKESAPILPQSPSQLVTMRISRPSSALLDAIFRWAGGEAGMEANKVALEELVKEASARTFLQYHLPDGPLLQEIQSAVAPSYTTRSIAPSNTDSTRARRRQSRKVTIPSTQATPGPSAPPAKRKKQQQLKTKQPAPFSISCQACGQTDVPLMMGGRYCRACIDGKKVPEQVYHIASSSSTSPQAPASAASYAGSMTRPPAQNYATVGQTSQAGGNQSPPPAFHTYYSLPSTISTTNTAPHADYRSAGQQSSPTATEFSVPRSTPSTGLLPGQSVFSIFPSPHNTGTK